MFYSLDKNIDIKHYCSNKMSHIRCEYCGILFPLEIKENELRHDQYPDNCATPILSNDNNIQCYSCGENDITKFSKSQINKKEKSRCIECINHNIQTRYKKYSDNLYFQRDCNKDKKDKKLYHAVACYNIEEVTQLLKDGANPNYIRQNSVYDIISNKHVYTFLSDGKEEPEYDLDNKQPTTPLKLVVFRISDCMLIDENLRDFNVIAKLLLDAGANKEGAIKFARNRYGIIDNENFEDDNNNEFMNVIKTIFLY